MSETELTKLKLPPITEVKVYNIDKIVNSRSKISVIEKIDLLRDLEAALILKLKANAENREAKKLEKL